MTETMILSICMMCDRYYRDGEFIPEKVVEKYHSFQVSHGICHEEQCHKAYEHFTFGTLEQKIKGGLNGEKI